MQEFDGDPNRAASLTQSFGEYKLADKIYIFFLVATLTNLRFKSSWNPISKLNKYIIIWKIATKLKWFE